MKEFLR